MCLEAKAADAVAPLHAKRAPRRSRSGGGGGGRGGRRRGLAVFAANRIASSRFWGIIRKRSTNKEMMKQKCFRAKPAGQVYGLFPLCFLKETARLRGVSFRGGGSWRDPKRHAGPRLCQVIIGPLWCQGEAGRRTVYPHIREG